MTCLQLVGRRDDFATALSGATAGVLAVTVLLQIVALLARSEAWHLTIEEAGGTVERRVLYRASSMASWAACSTPRPRSPLGSPRCAARPRTEVRGCRR